MGRKVPIFAPPHPHTGAALSVSPCVLWDLHVHAAQVKDSDTEAELRDAFRCLDEHGEGYIGVSQLRLICKNLGEDLTDDEACRRPVAVRARAASVLGGAARGDVGIAQLAYSLLLWRTVCCVQVYKMVGEAISNFDGKVYYDGFKKIMIVS